MSMYLCAKCNREVPEEEIGSICKCCKPVITNSSPTAKFKVGSVVELRRNDPREEIEDVVGVITEVHVVDRGTKTIIYYMINGNLEEESDIVAIYKRLEISE